MAQVPPPTQPPGCFSTYFNTGKEYGKTITDLVGCTTSNEKIDAALLRRQFHALSAAATLSVVLLIIGLLGQIGLLPIGSSLPPLSSSLGTILLLVTLYAATKYWKGLQDFQMAEAQGNPAVATAKTVSFLADRRKSMANFASFLGRKSGVTGQTGSTTQQP